MGASNQAKQARPSWPDTSTIHDRDTSVLVVMTALNNNTATYEKPHARAQGSRREAVKRSSRMDMDWVFRRHIYKSIL